LNKDKSSKLKFGILTVSDRSSEGLRADLSGPALVEAVVKNGWEVIWTSILPDDYHWLVEFLIAQADSGDVDILLTTGGTGFSPRDITPEATLAVIERQAPGLAESMRAEGLKFTPFAMLSRGIAGIREKTLIINLPGSPKAALENLDVIKPVLVHAIQILKSDSFADINHR